MGHWFGKSRPDPALPEPGVWRIYALGSLQQPSCTCTVTCLADSALHPINFTVTMSLQGLISGSECAVPFNPLSQVLKHTEGDRSVQQVCLPCTDLVTSRLRQSAGQSRRAILVESMNCPFVALPFLLT